MPTYSYKCDKCNRSWDGVNSVAERLNEKCPKCGANATIDVAAQGRTQTGMPDCWPLTTSDISGSPMTLNSRREFEAAMKAHGKIELDKAQFEHLPEKPDNPGGQCIRGRASG
jgi:putative FmdB family regulatory protein